MLHVHVRNEDEVVASEPGDPQNWVELRTCYPRQILEFFKDTAPLPPRIMHVTFSSGEFDLESGAELVIDTLNALENDADSQMRVWATSSGHSPTTHRHAKPARMIAASDLFQLREKFLTEEDSQLAESDEKNENPLEVDASRDTGGGMSALAQLHAELEGMRKVFGAAQDLLAPDADHDPTFRTTPALLNRVETIESELGQGQFGPLVHVEPDAKVYRQSTTDENGNTIKAVKIKPVTLEDGDGNTCYRNNTVAVVDCSDGSRLSEEVLRTTKVGKDFEEYAHLKNTKKSKKFGSSLVCWCKQEYKHKVPARLAPGTMNVDNSFDYLLSAKLLDAPDSKIDSYMDEEGRTVRKTKRMQKGTKKSSNGTTEDCWTSWVVKETRDPLDGGVVFSNKQRETRMSPELVHHALHNIVKTVVEETAQLVTTVTILVVHRIEPHAAHSQHQTAEEHEQRASMQTGTEKTNEKSLKDLQELLEAMGSDDEQIIPVDEQSPAAVEVQKVEQQQQQRVEIAANDPSGNRDAGGMAQPVSPGSDCIQEIPCEKKRKPGKSQTKITINVETCCQDRSTSGASKSSSKFTRSRKTEEVKSLTQRTLTETRAVSGDEENVGEECPPDEYDELLRDTYSPVVDDADMLELKRKKLNEELKQKWAKSVTKISLGELFLSMPRTTKTSLNAAHTELAQAKVAAMALRFNYGVQESEQGECPPWCSLRRRR